MAKIKVTLIWNGTKFEPKHDVTELNTGDEISFKVVTGTKGEEAKSFKLTFDPTTSPFLATTITETSRSKKVVRGKSESEFRCEAGDRRGGAQLPPVGGRAKK